MPFPSKTAQALPTVYGFQLTEVLVSAIQHGLQTHA